jgi:GNAT superfamily N-acetyltransferase
MPVRQIAAQDAEALRDMRLRSLRDAPWAFGSTLELEAAYSAVEWRERAEANAAGETTALFVAEEEGRWVGIAGGYVPFPERPIARLWGMWIEPPARGRGLAEELVEAVASWARSRGAVELELAVSDEALGAAAAYGRMGFTVTGERELLREGEELRTDRMARRL